jgi:monoamine oxidase
MTNDRRSIARREFLASIGRAVGGSAMLRVMLAMGIGSTAAGCGSSSAEADPASSVPPPLNRSGLAGPEDWPPDIGTGRSVVVLGAGIAGMVAAYELAKLGYRCTLLEAQPEAGGRIKTLRSGDTIAETDSVQTCQFDAGEELYFNAGPSRIAHHHGRLLGYCHEFGVSLESFTNDNRGAWLHSPNAFGGNPQVARTVFADTRGGIAALLSTAVNRGALDSELTATDQANILAMLREFGDLDASNSYAGTPRAGYPGQESQGSGQRGELLSPRRLEEFVTEFFWSLSLSFPEGLDQQPTMLQPVGGMDRIARAFEARVASALVLNARVTEIRKLPDGVRVLYEDGNGETVNLEADYAVITIPAPVLSGIPNDFSPEHSAEINGFRYTSAVRVAFQAPRFWEREHSIYGGITWTDQDITQIWYPNSGFMEPNGILIGAYIFDGAAGDRFASLTPAERLTRALDQASAVHPQMTRDAGSGISVAWKKMPFQLGGWGTSSASALLGADENIYFAGEHLSILQGWQEGAVLSAYKAIDGIVARDLET